jgi:hypothetical protein
MANANAAACLSFVAASNGHFHFVLIYDDTVVV